MSRLVPSLVTSAAAHVRRAHADAWLAGRSVDEEVLVIGANLEAAGDLVRGAAARSGAVFGWERTTLARFVGATGAPLLAARDRAIAAPLALEAVCARVLDGLRRAGGLERFQAVADRPGLVRAITHTIGELRMAGVDATALAAVDPPLALVLRAWESALDDARLADRAAVYRAALDRLQAENARGIARMPVVLVDVALDHAIQEDLVRALAARAAAVLAIAPGADGRTVERLARALGVAPRDLDRDPPRTSLDRLQRHLFSSAPFSSPPPDEEPGAASGSADAAQVEIVSAPGESRECVEIARRIHAEAELGTPFDRMAVLLRAPAQYRAVLEEALRRAAVPAHFARGSVHPDPAGRAFLALLACATDELSARRFAEYLSLGQVPDATDAGEPPPPRPSEDRWAPPDEEMIPDVLPRSFRAEADDYDLDDLRSFGAVSPPPVASAAAGGGGDGGQCGAATAGSAAVSAGSLRAPRRWERLLVEAAVIGGRERWARRLSGLAEELQLTLRDLESGDEGDGPLAARTRRDLAYLGSLTRFALPLVNALADLPREAPWGTWLDALSGLATRAISHPDRVLSVLAELAPMASVGPVSLDEVRLVLAPRLRDLVIAPSVRRAGKVLVAPIDHARGASFDVVFVPGLAEKIFPQKVVEDPILRDEARRRLAADRSPRADGSPGSLGAVGAPAAVGALTTDDDRVAAERLALHLAVGAARRRIVLTWPRVDPDVGRPRVPSFYALEVVRAAEGQLIGFEALARRGEQGSAARIGWPAPSSPMDAIDDAEHDLALLADLLRRPGAATRGTARYLLGANPHLARALRHRARRWSVRGWTKADGLVDPGPDAKRAIAAHALDARAYSATALQHFASCPYRFFLSAVHRLAPREEPEAIDEIDALQRGSLVHEVQYEFLRALSDAGRLPTTADTLDDARQMLDRALDDIAGRWAEKLAPAITRVWDDGIASIRADLREWLLRASGEREWVPWRFELSFGLPQRRGRDPHSQLAPVELPIGVRLRGSIDLVERSARGTLRATDHKTGRARVLSGATIAGGESLQPVLYALAVEAIFSGDPVEGGRLYYCTGAGGYHETTIPLDDQARAAAAVVATAIGEALTTPFLPAAPVKGACTWCDYRPVCGPSEEQRTERKRRDDPRILPLLRVRSTS